MLPNQVLNAIPRQKVKNINSDCEGEVIGFKNGTMIGSPSDKSVLLVWRLGRIMEWDTKDCEPVPEEPRGFRCGDKVVAWCKEEWPEFTTITAVMPNYTIGVSDIKRDGLSEGMYGQKTLSVRVETNHDFTVIGGQVRHATPQELKDYFLND
jgi:hypothetical protein